MLVFYIHFFIFLKLVLCLRNKNIYFGQLENAKKNHALDKHLLPLDIAIQSLPKICISKKYQSNFSQGQKIKLPLEDTIINKNIRVYDHNNQIVGLGCIESDGFLKPIRVFNLN